MCCNIAWSFNFHLSVIQCNISSKSFNFWSFNFPSAFNLHIHNLELVPWYIFRGKCHFYKSVSIILARIIHLTEVTKPIKNFNAYFTFQLWAIFSASIFILFPSASVKVFHFCMFIFFMTLRFYIHNDLSKNKFFHFCCCISLCRPRLKGKDFG